MDENVALVSELPASQNEINELADTSVSHEMPQELDSFQAPSRSSTGSSPGEPLPRYEPRRRQVTINQNSGWNATADPATNQYAWEQSERPSSSHSSLVTTPTRGLSLRDAADSSFDRHIASHEAAEKDASLCEPVEQSVRATNAPSASERSVSASDLQLLLKALRSNSDTLLVDYDQNQPSADNIQRPNTSGTETITKTESSNDTHSPSSRRSSKPKRRKTTSPSKRKMSALRARRATVDNSTQLVSSDEDITSDWISPSTDQLISKRMPASVGAEAIWVSVLQIQAKILGSEHPLAYQAKSDLARSRANGHVNGFEDLVSLRKSKFIAIETLGRIHPLVVAFSEDLTTLEQVTGGKRQQEHEFLPGVSFSDEVIMHHVKDEPSQNGVGSVEAGPSRTSRCTASSPTMDPKRTLPKITTTFHMTEPTATPPAVQADESYSLDALWNTGRPPHNPGNTLFTLPRLAFGEAMKLAVNGMLWLLHNYGPEPAVEPGKVRVRWTCSCGEQLYDDFVENRAGAARELEAYLNRPRVHTPGNGSPSSPESPYANRSFGASSFGSPHSSQTSWSIHNFQAQGSMGTDDTAKGREGGPRTYAGMPLYPQYINMPEPPWLLTCANEDRFAPKLAHLDMAKDRIRSDKDLAMSLRYHYFNVNKKWWRPLRLRGLTTIEFVQFELHQNRFADIRKCPDMPPKPTSDYDFVPSDLLPPVGSQYLLHLFKHPEDYDGELITYQRVPKKNGRLKMGVGYGINLVEGFLADRVWMLVTAFFAFGSLIFAVTWACKTHSIQGAYAVAAWMVSLAALAVGWLQAYIG